MMDIDLRKQDDVSPVFFLYDVQNVEARRKMLLFMSNMILD